MLKTIFVNKCWNCHTQFNSNCGPKRFCTDNCKKEYKEDEREVLTTQKIRWYEKGVGEQYELMLILPPGFTMEKGENHTMMHISDEDGDTYLTIWTGRSHKRICKLYPQNG